MHKARRAFFALGSIGAFHSRLNSLTGHSLFETFVVPTMLYGCETWILSVSHFHILEMFQAEIGKCILGDSKYYCNTSTLIGLHWPSVKARVLIRKQLSWPNYWKGMMFSAHMFFELWLLPMFTRSVSYSNAVSWNNRLALAIYSYVSRILQMHTQ